MHMTSIHNCAVKAKWKLKKQKVRALSESSTLTACQLKHASVSVLVD